MGSEERNHQTSRTRKAASWKSHVGTSSAEGSRQLQRGPVNGASVPGCFLGVSVWSRPKRGGLTWSGCRGWLYWARDSSASRNKLWHCLSGKTDNLLKIARAFANPIHSLLTFWQLLQERHRASWDSFQSVTEWALIPQICCQTGRKMAT